MASLTATNFGSSDIYNPSSDVRNNPTTANTFAEFCALYEDPLDGSVMAGWINVTGDQRVDANGVPLRAKAPQEVYSAFGITDPTTWHNSDPDYSFDFWDLNIDIMWMKSTDSGATFADVRTDDANRHKSPSRTFTSNLLIPTGYFPQPTIAIKVGGARHILRRVNGEDILHDPDIPHQAYLERSTDNGATWGHAGPSGAVCRFGMTTATTVQVARMRLRSDGALVAIGQLWNATEGQRANANYTQPFMSLSYDGGYTWTGQVINLPANWVGGASIPERVMMNEWDIAEMGNGDWFWVARSGAIPWNGTDSGGTATSSQYNQGRLVKVAGQDRYNWTQPVACPFTATGGPTYPELNKIWVNGKRHILFFGRTNASSPSGWYSTDDAGATWNAIGGISGISGSLPYYARSVIIYPNGVPTVLVIGHDGGDDYFGKNDHKIRVWKFGLTEAGAGGGGSILESVPATGATDAANGGVGNWANPQNILTSDTVYATIGLSAGQTSGRLIAKDFLTATPTAGQTNLSSLPDNAVITGISMMFRRRSSVSSVLKEHELLLMIENVAGTVNLADTASFLTTTNAWRVTSSSMWGFASITGAQLKAATSGVIFVAKNVHASTTATCSVDAVRLAQVDYTIPGAGGGTFSKVYTRNPSTGEIGYRTVKVMRGGSLVDGFAKRKT